MAYVVVKLKIFEDFCTDSISMKWPFFGASLPQILFDLAETLTINGLQ